MNMILVTAIIFEQPDFVSINCNVRKIVPCNFCGIKKNQGMDIFILNIFFNVKFLF